MFRIPLSTRFEVIHPHDAGLAIANGICSDVYEPIILAKAMPWRLFIYGPVHVIEYYYLTGFMEGGAREGARAAHEILQDVNWIPEHADGEELR